ncbi:hypothetical protein KM043_018360 [Ampulex compressa]|nr:hypothetical protein KM043_018360 [Ampulex compressa]
MRYLASVPRGLCLCFLGIAFCDAARITRGLEYSEFPNFQAVYHGHGATSYQNIEMHHHDSISIPKGYAVHDGLHLPNFNKHHEYREVIPIVETDTNTDHIALSKEPLEDIFIKDVVLNPGILPHYYDNYEKDHEYEHHI